MTLDEIPQNWKIEIIRDKNSDMYKLTATARIDNGYGGHETSRTSEHKDLQKAINLLVKTVKETQKTFSFRMM